MKIINFILFSLFLHSSISAITYFEGYEDNVYENLVKRFSLLQKSYGDLCRIWNKDRYFINGLVRKYRPKKILEVGVFTGCSSLVILNAIKDIEGSFLYSVDLLKTRQGKKIGSLVDDFPDLKKKWKLFTKGYVCQFLEEIKGEIDFVFLDTSHSLPGEALDFLMFLPFLSKNAVVIIHDVVNQFFSFKGRTSNNLLFPNIRGQKLIPYPNSKEIPFHYFHNIGGIILDDNQEKYYFDYFFLLLSQWGYYPDKKDFNIILKFLEKYYSKEYIEIFKLGYKYNSKNLKKMEKKGKINRAEPKNQETKEKLNKLKKTKTTDL